MSKVELITQEMINYFNSGAQKPWNTQEDTNRYNNQVKYEDSLLSKLRICHTSGNKSIMGISIGDLDKSNTKVLSDYIQKNSHDINVMEATRCFLNTIIDIEDDNGESQRGRINKFITHLQKFGANSAYGFPLRGKIKTTNTYHELSDDLIVVKCPREPSNSSELIHELCIGLEGLNALRGRGEDGSAAVPFFAYVFDAYYCSPPIIETSNDGNKKKNEVIEWCMSGENPVAYVIYENVTNAIPFADVSKDNSEKNISDVLLSLISFSIGLKHAQHKLKYCHCDLHTDNILWKLVSKEDMFIELPYNGKNIKVLSSNRIPIAIDYGMNRMVTKDNKIIGKLDKSGFFKNIGVAYEKPNAIADMHKLLCFILMNAVQDGNDLLKDIIYIILKYFYDSPLVNANNGIENNDILTILQYQNPFKYNFPIELAERLNWNLDYLIEHMRNVYTQIFEIDPLCMNENEEHNISIKYKQRFGIENIQEKLKTYGSNHITLDLEEVKQILTNVTETTCDENYCFENIPTLFSLVNSPNELQKNKKLIQDNMDYVFSREETELNKYCIDNINLLLINIPTQNKELLDSSLEQFEKSIIKVAETLDLLVKVNTYITTYQSALKIIQSKSIKKLLKKANRYFSKYIEQFFYIRNGIFDGHKFLSKLIFDKELDKNMNSEELKLASNSKYYNLFYNYQTVRSIFIDLNI